MEIGYRSLTNMLLDDGSIVNNMMKDTWGKLEKSKLRPLELLVDNKIHQSLRQGDQ